MENDLFSIVTELIPPNERDILMTFHNNAVNAEFIPFVTKSDKKISVKLNINEQKK